MKVLMFGWEFPPHISGGLGTACFGLTQAMHKLDVEVLFVVPKSHGDEPQHSVNLINASDVKISREEIQLQNSVETVSHEVGGNVTVRAERHVQNDVLQIAVDSNLSPYRTVDEMEHIIGIESWNYQIQETAGYTSVETVVTQHINTQSEKKAYPFSGTYGKNLLEETQRYAAVAGELAIEYSFDIIHAHDWMTYPAGIAAKKVSGKPLVVHVHATEHDRAGDGVDPRIFSMEQEGMLEADMVLTVSMRTKRIVIDKYGIPEHKIHVVHNGIIPKEQPMDIVVPKLGSHVVTFLGRVTHQKGPQYFVEAARLILLEFPDAHFIVAGSGDLLPQVIERVAELRLSKHFHFTGFLKGKQIEKIWAMTDTYVMPSVSEPFGIAPLEAIQGGVPVVLSKQSGVAEVMPHAIKVDFWDIEALANSICGILKYKSLATTLKKNSSEEIEFISWEKVAKKIKH